MNAIWAGIFLAVVLAALAGVIVCAEQVLISRRRFSISINSGQRKVESSGGRSVLDALNRNGIYLPSACGGRGTCGYCKVKILAGGGAVLPTEEAALSRRDIRAGMRLACQVKPFGDVTLEIPEDILSARMRSGVVRQVASLTGDVREILVCVDDGEFSFAAGQYIQIACPTDDVNDGQAFRSYSICSSADSAGDFRLVVRRVPGGLGSEYLHSLSVGERISFAGPYGQFRFGDFSGELVCIAGGCGVGAALGVAESYLSARPNDKCTLIVGFRTLADAFYLDRMESLAAANKNFRFVISLSVSPGHGQAWGGMIGHVHLAVEKVLQVGCGTRRAFVCGPKAMIVETLAVLEEKQFADEEIYFDSFD